MSQPNPDITPETTEAAPAVIPLLTIDRLPLYVDAKLSTVTVQYFMRLLRQYPPDPASQTYELELIEHIIARRDLVAIMQTPPPVPEAAQEPATAPENAAEKIPEETPPC